jgi:apolipoprotein N-acyltransferase
LTGAIRPMAGLTPYARIGDGPVVVFISALLLVVLLLIHWGKMGLFRIEGKCPA